MKYRKYAVICVAAYLLGVFAKMSFNPMEWEEKFRFAIGIVAAIAALIIYIMHGRDMP